MSSTQYRNVTQQIAPRMKILHERMPDVMKGFQEMNKAVMIDGALDAKTKELIALAIGVAARCEGCVGFHAQALARLGATRLEVDEMLSVAIFMGGGPSVMWATEAMTAFNEFAPQDN
ncbi:alkyl hydroperoxide reductase AhpD [Betaproteobacteria bacterium]|nr:alkyl hydroperoxide reductase AhpD [Betaproteobacteria bacterium]